MMKTNRALALTALPLALAFVLAGCAGAADDDSMPGMDHGEMSESGAPADAAAEANDADATFAAMMIPHHQQAIEMSDMILAKEDVDERVQELAQQIRDAQGPEIEQMQAWLDEWGVAAEAHEGMDHGDGMMSEDDMAALEAADGPEASRLFLEQMIVHHEGAVDMAQTELEDGSDPDALELAEAIIDTQTAEIAAMQELLAEL